MKRLESLDALRGFDMLFISGGASLLIALAALFPDNAVWQVIDEQMRHVSWDGLRHHDTIFPLFLFIAGISWPFSLAAQRERGASCGKIYLKIVRRGLTLFLLGMIYGGLLNMHWDTQRLCSVLGRIGLAWMFAALLYLGSRLAKAVGLLGGIACWVLVVQYLVGGTRCSGRSRPSFA